ncbi:MAG: DUF2807 domain-containing protein [Bacteroidota bacterium]|nr:DUF2807 domain-containing protein [Bacteroidota bacterium]
MKSIFIFLFIIAGSPGFAQQTIISDANAEVRDVPSFTGIKVSGGIDVYLSQSENYSLAVSAADQENVANIKTEVKNDVLLITYSDGNSRRNSSNKKLRAYISFKTLESIEGSGACDFYINNSLTGNSLLVKLSGACDIKGPVKLTNLSIELTGASTVKLSGTAQNLKIDASGASDIKNYDLTTENCIAKLSGASDVRITVTNSITASASGASTLFYRGDPDKRDVASSGASSISQKN